MRENLTKKLEVLFWDDEAEGKKKLLFTEIRLGLKKSGWTPHIVVNKDEALAFALECEVDAVVLDLKEEGRPVGLDMLKTLREKKPFLPIIMFTIHADVEFIQSAMRGQASYYLIWPIKGYLEVVQAVEIAVDREKAKESLFHDKYFSSIGELAGGVAHFIKNSLHSIKSSVQILLDQADENDETYRFMEIIDKRCNDANKVVVDLLNFAKGKKEKSEIKELNIVKSIESVFSLLDPDLKYKNIEIKMTCNAEDGKIKGVEFDLKEAFLNIIKNAIEAMPEGGTLAVQVNSSKEDVTVEISDTGLGMTEKTMNNLFMPFYTTKANSSGIGLFITRKIIHAHNGTIRVNSKTGEGSTFLITLPKGDRKIDSKVSRLQDIK